MNSDNRDVPAAPITRFKKYRKFGFALTRTQVAYCPSCESQINAGPNYMPERCSECGQLFDWVDYRWALEEFMMYLGDGNNSVDADFHPID